MNYHSTQNASSAITKSNAATPDVSPEDTNTPVDLYSSSPAQDSNTNGKSSECVLPLEPPQYNPDSLIDTPMDVFDDIVVKSSKWPGITIISLYNKLNA